MALLNESQLRRLARAQRGYARDSADQLLKSISKSSSLSSFHIFLSHSHLDLELLNRVISFLDGLGYSLYVDSRVGPAPGSVEVTKDAAEQVRNRLRHSKSLFFATTEGSKDSRWMPWELGYMDGKTGKCAILPISSFQTYSDSFKGRGYLGVYPYITSSEDTKGKQRIWVHEDSETYVSFDGWFNGTPPHTHG